MAAHNERMIFNYPLPTEYYPAPLYCPVPQWTTPTSTHSNVPRTVPAGGYVDPRKLQRSCSSSSDEMDYSRYTRSPVMHSSRQRVHPVVLNQTHGHQPTYVPTGYPESSGGRRGTSHRTLHPQLSLPSPPLSPHSPTAIYPTITTASHHHHNPSRYHHDHTYISPSSSNPLSPTTTTTVSSTSRHFCNHPSCIDPLTSSSTKSFSRHADLIRHQKSLHGMVDEDGKIMPKYDCPRSRCNRKGPDGFTRLDHLTEHRRGYHGEDIPRRRTSATRGED